tara:strand:- start:8536 stop:8856 length:321 start_codon:yes stop_codon:yes gene_type:complete
MAGEIQDFRIARNPRSMHLAMYSVVDKPSCLARFSAARFNSSSIHKLIWRLSLSLTFGIKIGVFRPQAGRYGDAVKEVNLIFDRNFALFTKKMLQVTGGTYTLFSG